LLGKIRSNGLSYLFWRYSDETIEEDVGPIPNIAGRIGLNTGTGNYFTPSP
jgi:hypothetical protein